MPEPLLLVVEDDVALLEGLRDMLELGGYRVATARNGLEALACLEQQLPDLIVSDINMPRLDGYQLFSQVRARPEWVAIPFIFLTAKGEKADVRHGKGLGVDDYITKPFDEADLLVAVQAKLQRRAQLDAAHLRQVADLKRSILTTLNHEFRTPLTYITGYAELLGDQNLTPDDLRTFLRGIQAGSDRLKQLVEDFILLVELQTGEAEEAFRQRRTQLTDLPALVRNVLGAYEARAAARHVRLAANLPSSLPPIMADPVFLADALGRLVENGIKFRRGEGGQVRVSGRAEADGVLLEVADNGIGMPSAELARIFDVFYQIDRAKREQQGSGSGLAIVLGVARLHGGELRVTSEPGQGSTFVLALPAA